MADQERACTLAESGLFAEAASAYRALILSNENDAYLHEALAQCLQELGPDYNEEAYTAAVRAVELAPQWAEGYLTFGRVCRNVGQLAEALRALKTCKLLSPGAVEAEELSEIEDLISQHLSTTIEAPVPIRLHTGGPELGPASVTWDCGVLLSWYLCRRAAIIPGGLRGRRVLELGAGTGVVGIVAASLGAEASLTDLPEVVPLLQRNISRNEQSISAQQGHAECWALNWAAPDLSRLLTVAEASASHRQHFNHPSLSSHSTSSQTASVPAPHLPARQSGLDVHMDMPRSQSHEGRCCQHPQHHHQPSTSHLTAMSTDCMCCGSHFPTTADAVIVLGADLVHSHAHIVPFVNMLSAVQSTFKASGCPWEMCIAHKSRRDELNTSLWHALHAAGFQLRCLHGACSVLQGQHPEYQNIELYCCYNHPAAT